MNASVPIEASGIIPVAQSDVAGIPSIALSIPDFEGQAILRLFGNSTESEIGCYSAVVTNGNSFSQPAAVGSVLGIFTVLAVVASFATAIYGEHIPTTRTHYAHSLSVFVLFSVFHHIYFTGALSMNWPSVLPAFWSNYAWSGGMVYSEVMQNSINKLIGANTGNTSMVGAASSGSASNDLGGGYSISQIYKRSFHNMFARDLRQHADFVKNLRSSEVESSLAKRTLVNSTDGYSWYGSPVKPGLPLPGNFSGFAGTLAEEDIPASNAFMTGFLWFLILVAIVVGSIMFFKLALEGLTKLKVMKKDRLSFFRNHWSGFAALAALRTMLIAFFMMMFLTMFEFTYKGSGGVTAIAAIVFLVFFLGLSGIAVYACYYRVQFGRYATSPDRLHLEHRKALGFIPLLGLTRESQRSEKSDPVPSAGSLPWWNVSYVSEDPQRLDVHNDEDFNKKFGWLSARFRRTRWWFFAVWLLYEFIRACFYGGAAGHPMTQVFGLLVVEFIALLVIIALKPFEGSRLNVLMVYILGFSKVATIALSAAFDSRFNLPRIITTVIGVVIIVIQGILTIMLLIAIVVGAISSYMSVTRNREKFKPRKLGPMREKYFKHINQVATDLPPPPPPVPEEPKEPYFNVASVRRYPKIEDEDEDTVADINDPFGSRISVGGGVARGSRANSMRSITSYTNNIPFGARVHRASWSSKDFKNWHEAGNRNSELMSRDGLQSVKSNQSLRDAAQQWSRTPSRGGPAAMESRTPSRGGSGPLEMKKLRNGKEKEKEKEKEQYSVVDERQSEEQT